MFSLAFCHCRSFLEYFITEMSSYFDGVVLIVCVLCFSRWWFASTAFPLIAGTFGPMASAFSICALVVHWRVRIPPGGVEEHAIFLADPKWYV